MRLKGWLLLLVAFFGLVIVTLSFSSEKIDKSIEFSDKYVGYPLHIPDKLDFAGERVPLEYFDVKESMDRELHVNTYWQSQTIFYLKRANRYFPEIDSILKSEHVPSDFKYLAIAESGLTNIVSPSNAVGFWQFLKNTGKECGLEINSEIDERYNLEKSTRAACKFFKQAYKLFNNWTLAAASYNMGKPALLKTLEIEKEFNYYDLALNEETSRYIYRILAIKIIIENPDLYGFHVSKPDLYPVLNYTVIKTDTVIPDMAAFAKKHNTNYKMLKLFNPWLRDDKLTNIRKIKYFIRIPSEGYRESLYNEAKILADTTNPVKPQIIP
jgi:hypothetical protein